MVRHSGKIVITTAVIFVALKNWRTSLLGVYFEMDFQPSTSRTLAKDSYGVKASTVIIVATPRVSYGVATPPFYRCLENNEDFFRRQPNTFSLKRKLLSSGSPTPFRLTAVACLTLFNFKKGIAFRYKF